MDTVEVNLLQKAVINLFDEGYIGPSNPNGTWFTDNEPNCGILGTLKKISAEEASRKLLGPDSDSIAAHSGHVKFSLDLVNKVLEGENPYAETDWDDSWKIQEVNQDEWKTLQLNLEKTYKIFRKKLKEDIPWDNEAILTETLAQLAHGAWHLGAIRQMLLLLDHH